MPDPITSVQNPRVKQATRLREASHRRETGLMLIDGLKEIRQALLGHVSLLELFVDHRCTSIVEQLGLQPNEITPTLLRQLEQVTTSVSTQVLEKLAFGHRNEYLVAVAKQPSVELLQIQDSQTGLILVIDQAEKPGNIGAMIRTADAVGATAVLLSDPVCEVWNSNAIRASLGAIFRLPIAVGTSAQIIEWLTNRNYQLIAARVDGTINFRNFTWSKKNAIVVGSESNGLGPAWDRSQIVAMQLPMRGTVDSLNVSVTAGILLYEAAMSSASATREGNPRDQSESK